MQTVTIPFYTVEVRFDSAKGHFVAPLQDSTVFWLNTNATELTAAYQKRFQKECMDKGAYMSLLEFGAGNDFELRPIKVQFKSPKDYEAFDVLTVNFDYLIRTTEQGYHCFVPALGLECFTQDEEGLETTVAEAIYLDFMGKNRLSVLQEVLSTMWYGKIELHNYEMTFNVYTPTELNNLENKDKDTLLPQVAKALNIEKQQLFGYKAELKKLLELLQHQQSRNILLVGPAGVGKTTLIYELVRQAKLQNINFPVWETTAATLIKELTGEVGWQENLALLCKELTSSSNVLYIRNLLDLFEVGQYEGNAVSVGLYLKDFLARGTLSMISECTDEAFARIEMQAPGYLAYFQVVRVQAPRTPALLEEVVLNKLKQIAEEEKVLLDTDAVREVIRLNKRYTPYSGFPGKPIQFIQRILTEPERGNNRVSRSAVIEAFCEEAGMPRFMVDPAVPMDLEQVEHYFKENIFGQEAAIKTMTDVLASVKTALLRSEKPIASLLFVGPTGVGKTEMAKVLAKFMFGDRNKMVRFDMSEYSTAFDIARLTGQGLTDEGLLTAAVRRNPFCVLLFDELEKAHPLFNDLLLQMLGEGRLTDSQGNVVNFCSTIIIMTSNLGAQKMQQPSIGWSKEVDPNAVANQFVAAVQQFFRPEIYNRMDKVLPFFALDKKVVRYVVQRELKLVKEREGLKHRNVSLSIETPVVDYLVKVGYNPKYGARALQRALREEIVLPLAEQLNLYAFDDQLTVTISYENEKLLLDTSVDEFKFELMLEELTQDEYMDYASELRLDIQSLQEGTVFLNLLNTLDDLNYRKRHNADFWKNQEVVNQVSELSNMKLKMEQHIQQIEGAEQSMALVSMGIDKLNTKLYEALQTWEEQFKQLKLELYSLMFPTQKLCYLSVWGEATKALYTVYQEIFEATAWEISATAYSVDRVLYDEGQASANDIVQLDLELEDLAKEPWVKAEQHLFGLVYTIKGAGSDLYLSAENGTHTYQTSDKEKIKSVVAVSSVLPLIETLYLKKNAVTKLGKPDRVYGVNTMEDSRLGIPKREVPQRQQGSYLKTLLDKRFDLELNGVLK